MGIIDGQAQTNNMANIMKGTSDALKNAQKYQEENLEVIQDTMALNQEMQYNQDEINALLDQQNEQFNEGLDDELAELDDLDILDATENYQQTNTNKQQNKQKEEENFDSIMNQFVN